MAPPAGIRQPRWAKPDDRQVVPEGYPGGNSQFDVENPWLQMVVFPHVYFVYVSLEEG